MATSKSKSKTKTGTARSRQTGIQWHLEDFTPEWASERVERLTTAVDEMTQEFQTRADELQSRGEKLRKDGQKRFEKRVRQARADLRKMPAVKRAEKLRTEFEKRVEQNMDAVGDRVLSTLGLASADEVRKLERKIAQLTKKLRSLEKAKAA
jgi:vacuolar-type H+-ATPase subunit E/Vma4